MHGCARGATWLAFGRGAAVCVWEAPVRVCRFGAYLVRRVCVPRLPRQFTIHDSQELRRRRGSMSTSTGGQNDMPKNIGKEPSMPRRAAPGNGWPYSRFRHGAKISQGGVAELIAGTRGRIRPPPPHACWTRAPRTESARAQAYLGARKNRSSGGARARARPGQPKRTRTKRTAAHRQQPGHPERQQPGSSRGTPSTTAGPAQ